MKKIVYLINLILVVISCTIPSLKAVNGAEEQWNEARKILFLCLNNDKDVTCAQCKQAIIPHISRAKQDQEENQALIQSECLYCAYFKIHSQEKRYVFLEEKYKFHTTCYSTLSNKIKTWLKNTTKNSTLCNECRKKTPKPALNNQGSIQDRNEQSNADCNCNLQNCDPDFVRCFCILLCLPCFAAAN